MTVGIKVDGIIDELGSADFVHAFFSTISFHLEPCGWGTKFPVLMNELYQGTLPSSKAASALDELRVARERLRHVGPDQVVWDIKDSTKQPPWGDAISSDITDLSNYFVTSTGRDLFETLMEVLEESTRVGKDATIGSC